MVHATPGLSATSLPPRAGRLLEAISLLLVADPGLAGVLRLVSRGANERVLASLATLALRATRLGERERRLLRRCAGLVRLQLEGCGADSLAEPGAWGHLASQLIDLDLVDPTSPELLPAALEGLARLQLLRVEGCDLSRLPAQPPLLPAAALGALRLLQLPGCQLARLPGCVALLTALEELHLEDNALEELPGEALAGLAALR
jgi:hypothetical protein